MPVVFVLADAAGKPVRIPDPAGGTADAAGDLDRFVGGGDEDLPALGRIDAHTESAFGGDELDALLADIGHVNGRTDLKPMEQRGLARLVALIRHAKNDPSTTLRCIGD